MPTSVETYDQAIELQQSGKLEEAVGRLHELLEQDPAYALAHSALSVFYQKMDRNDEAIEHGRRACELQPHDPFSYVALSMICQKADRIPEAEQALMQARQAQAAASQQRTPE
jgi:Flp pilus assembly protein TadD